MKTTPKSNSTSSKKPPSSNPIIVQMVVLIVCRLLLNTGRRFIYPFAPAFSRALGVPLTAITSMIALNWATALLGLGAGPLADRWGYRKMMIAGLVFLTAGLLVGGSIAVYSAVLAGLALAGLGKSVFDPAVQAYVSEQVPFQRRGLAIGFLEVAWAASALIGIPLVGYMIEMGGWRAPFFALSALGAMGLLALAFFVPADNRISAVRANTGSWWPVWKEIIRNRTIMGAFGFSFFVQMANDILFVVYGAWMEEAFQLSIVGIGLGTSVIGFAELTGEFTTAGLSDRVGLKRSLVIGVMLCTLAYLIMPFLAGSLSIALAGLFVLFFAFEVSVVTGLSLATEMSPDARATMMSGYFAAAGMGRVAGALIGGPVWFIGGMPATAMVSAGINTLALVSLVWGLRGWQAYKS